MEVKSYSDDEITKSNSEAMCFEEFLDALARLGAKCPEVATTIEDEFSEVCRRYWEIAEREHLETICGPLHLDPEKVATRSGEMLGFCELAGALVGLDWDTMSRAVEFACHVRWQDMDDDDQDELMGKLYRTFHA